MIGMKKLMIQAIEQTNTCTHRRPPKVKACTGCLAITLDGLVRWYLAADLRNFIYNETLPYKDEPEVFNKLLNEDYWLGFQQAINMIDPAGQTFIDIMNANNLIEQEQN